MTQGIWNIELFGRLLAVRDGREITRFRTEKTGVLLACLAQEPSRPCQRDELSARLWPGHDVESARNCLRVALASLRLQLEPEPAERGKIIVADRSRICLNPAQFTTDKAAFEEALRAAAQAQDDRARVVHLEQAVACYRTGFLPEFNDGLIAAERKRLLDAYLLARRRLVRAYINLRQDRRALITAQRAVEAAPLREESHRILMFVYAKFGRPSAAQRQYDAFNALLASEAALNAGGAAGEAVPSAASTEEEPSDRVAHPANALAAAPVDRVVGRHEAIRQIREMLDTPETRLVTLTGPAGVGKTRLARAVAAQVRAQDDRSAYVVALAPLVAVEHIVPTVAAHLKVAPGTSLGRWDQVREALTGRHILLVLDNLDHLPPDAGETVNRFLATIPTLTCLVTCGMLSDWTCLGSTSTPFGPFLYQHERLKAMTLLHIPAAASGWSGRGRTVRRGGFRRAIAVP